jgi:hypothetical protein
VSAQPHHLGTQVCQYTRQLVECGVGSVRLLHTAATLVCNLCGCASGKAQLHSTMALGCVRGAQSLQMRHARCHQALSSRQIDIIASFHLEGRDMCVIGGLHRLLLLRHNVTLINKAAQRLEVGLCCCRCSILAAWHTTDLCSSCRWLPAVRHPLLLASTTSALCAR